MEQQQISVEVGMAELKVGRAPQVLITRGLGSCVGIVIYDTSKKIGGMAHPMLPEMSRAKVRANPAKFVDTAINALLENLKKEGSDLKTIWAKIFGGGHMFSAIPYDSPFNIGVKNVTKAKEVLVSKGIKLIAEDTGGNFGRTIELDLSTGKVRVKTLFHGEKEL